MDWQVRVSKLGENWHFARSIELGENNSESGVKGIQGVGQSKWVVSGEKRATKPKGFTTLGDRAFCFFL